MRETVLRDFFEGAAAADDLDSDTAGAFKQESPQSRRLVVETMEEPFGLRSDHVVKLCDAVIAGRLDPANLEAIGFALIASDQFEWTTDTEDGERVGEVLFDWSAPEINHDLTVENVRRWRHYLVTGEPAFPKQGS